MKKLAIALVGAACLGLALAGRGGAQDDSDDTIDDVFTTANPNHGVEATWTIVSTPSPYLVVNVHSRTFVTDVDANGNIWSYGTQDPRTPARARLSIDGQTVDLGTIAPGVLEGRVPLDGSPYTVNFTVHDALGSLLMAHRGTLHSF